MKVLDYIFFTRSILILPMFTIMLLGVRAADLREGASPFFSAGIPGNAAQVFLMMLYTLLIYGAVYIYNQIHDIESDRANGKLYFLPKELISIKNAYIFLFILAALALVGAYREGFAMGLVFTAIALTGFLYSYPGTNYKGRAGKALWSNIIGCGALPFLIGWVLVTGSITLEAVLKSVPYMMAVGAVYFNTILPDKEGDRVAGKKTFALSWSVKHVQSSALFRIFLAVLTGLMAGDFAIFIAALICVPFFVHALVKREIKESVLASKISILVLALFAGIYFPLYAILFVVIVLATRVYYKNRFDVNYPAV